MPGPQFALPYGLAPLGFRNFALYWVGLLGTSAGSKIEQIGAIWLVYELTQSPVLLGLIGVASAIPSIVTAPFAGVLTDRLNSRKLLFVTQLLSSVVSFALGLLILLGQVEVWHVYVQLFMASCIKAFDIPARQTLFPSLLPRALLADGVTLSISAGRLSRVFGPALGGVAIATMGVSAPFFLNAASCLALMYAVLLMRGTRVSERAEKVSLLSALVEGWNHIVRSPVIRGAFQMEVVFSLFGLNSVMITIVARELLAVGPGALGLLLAAPGVGSVIGLAWMVVVGPVARQGRFGIVCTLTYAAALVIFACFASFSVMFAALTLLGVLDVLVNVTRNSILQVVSPDHMRGRIMSNLRIITAGVGPLSDTQSGFMASLLGGPTAVLVAAGALSIAAGITASANKPLWRYVAEGRSRTKR